MRITNISELIDFVSRKDVSFKDAEAVTNKCFGIHVIAFRDYDPDLDTKDNLIQKINTEYQKAEFIHFED
jgi:hypothetical protein